MARASWNPAMPPPPVGPLWGGHFLLLPGCWQRGQCRRVGRRPRLTLTVPACRRVPWAVLAWATGGCAGTRPSEGQAGRQPQVAVALASMTCLSQSPGYCPQPFLSCPPLEEGGLWAVPPTSSGRLGATWGPSKPGHHWGMGWTLPQTANARAVGTGPLPGYSQPLLVQPWQEGGDSGHQAPPERLPSSSEKRLGAAVGAARVRALHPGPKCRARPSPFPMQGSGPSPQPQPSPSRSQAASASDLTGTLRVAPRPIHPACPNPHTQGRVRLRLRPCPHPPCLRALL